MRCKRRREVGCRQSQNGASYHQLIGRSYRQCRIVSSEGPQHALIFTAETSLDGQVTAKLGVMSRGECVGTKFPLLKCLRTPRNAQNCGILHYTISKFSYRSDIPGFQQAPRCFDLDANFRLARQRSNCSCFT